MSIFRESNPPKPRRDGGSVHSMTAPHDPKGPPYGPGDVRHVPPPPPARIQNEKK